MEESVGDVQETRIGSYKGEYGGDIGTQCGF